MTSFHDKNNNDRQILETLDVVSLVNKSNPHCNRGYSPGSKIYVALHNILHAKPYSSPMDSIVPSKSTILSLLNSNELDLQTPLFDSCAELFGSYLIRHTGDPLLFVIDDSKLVRTAAPKAEGISLIKDRTHRKTVLGYSCVTLSLVCGKVKCVLGFGLVASSKSLAKPNTYRNAKNVFLRPAAPKTQGFAIRQDILSGQVQVALSLVEKFSNLVIKRFKRSPEAVLVDSWYGDNINFVEAINRMGIEVVGMLKLRDTVYIGQEQTLVQLNKLAKDLTIDLDNQNIKASPTGIIQSMTMRRAYPSKAQKKLAQKQGHINNDDDINNTGFVVVFVTNDQYSDSRPLLPLMSTNYSQDAEEIQSTYRLRWSIETIFKTVKGVNNGMNIQSYQGRSLNGFYNHICMCFMLYNIFSFKSLFKGNSSFMKGVCTVKAASLHSVGITFRMIEQGFDIDTSLKIYSQARAMAIYKLYRPYINVIESGDYAPYIPNQLSSYVNDIYDDPSKMHKLIEFECDLLIKRIRSGNLKLE